MIIQLIDTMNFGGAERVALNYVKALNKASKPVLLVTSRTKGPLLDQLNDSIRVTCLNKKSFFDIRAFYRFYRLVKKCQVTVIHAHGASIYWGTIMKLLLPKLFLIWHVHSEKNSHKQSLFYRLVFKILVKKANLILVVNQSIKKWFLLKNSKLNVHYLSNFILEGDTKISERTFLKGVKSKRVLCLTNLRAEKNHDFLLDAIEIIQKDYPQWTFHIVGRDTNDQYAERIKTKIATGFNDKVFYYGERSDVNHIISQADIGVLVSKFEGLSMSFLEYGYYGLAVITTNVGELPNIIENGKDGLVVDSDNVLSLVNGLKYYLDRSKTRLEHGSALQKKIRQSFSSNTVISQYLTYIYGI